MQNLDLITFGYSQANPNQNPKREGKGAIFFGGDIWNPIKTNETKNQKEIKINRRKEKQKEQKRLSFIKLSPIFPETRTLKSSR